MTLESAEANNDAEMLHLVQCVNICKFCEPSVHWLNTELSQCMNFNKENSSQT